MVEVLKYINNNIKSKISLDEMAAMAGYSTYHFCRKFKQYTNENFKDYIQKRQMQIAVDDILAGKNTIEIAAEMGYNSRWGFTRSFIREFGVTPTQFRNSYRKQLIEHKSRPEDSIGANSRLFHLLNKETEELYRHRMRGQRLYWFVKGYYDVSPRKRTAENLMCASLISVIKNSVPIIRSNELIVGYNYDQYFHEVYGIEKLNKQIHKQLITEYLKPSQLTEAQINELIYLTTEAPDRFRSDYTNNLYLSGFRRPPDLSIYEKNAIEDAAVVGCCSVNHHAIISYEKVLQMGFRGIKDWITDILRKNKEHRPFYNNLLKVCNVAADIGNKYAQEAQRLLETETDEKKRVDYMQIIENCKQVPALPAQTFAQALQCIYFVNILNTWEDGINENSFGRLDQLLYPYYCYSLASGRITRKEALELLCAFLIKIYGSNNEPQQIVIGGSNQDGSCVVNELSYMFLDAIQILDIACPLAIRYSPKITNRRFIKKVFEVISQVKNTTPIFLNDDVVIPALITHGIATVDAYDYALAGCSGITIPGKTNHHPASGQINLLKALEYAINGGKSLFDAKKICATNTGSADSFSSFSSFMNAVTEQLEYIITLSCRLIDYNIPFARDNSPVPFKSLLTDNCVVAGKDYNAGGPLYNYYQVMLFGFPNLVDSLAAINTLVFERHEYTLDYIRKQMYMNFPDKKLYGALTDKVPKYGNNLPVIKKLALPLFNKICDIITANSNNIGQQFHAQFYTYLWNVDFGKQTAATPDGRYKSDPLACGMSPVPGQDFNGLYALLLSLASYPFEKAPGMFSVTIDIEDNLLYDINRDKLIDVFLNASLSGLPCVQFNSYQNKQTDKSVIAVSGFSQSSDELSDSSKNQVKNRTKHKTI